MSYINKTNTAGEEIIAKFKFTKLEYLNPLKLILFPRTWVRRWCFEMGVTNRRLVFKHGFIRRRTGEIRLESIESVSMGNSLIGRIFGYGDITVTGRGNAHVTVPGLASIVEVKKAIDAAKNEFGTVR